MADARDYKLDIGSWGAPDGSVVGGTDDGAMAAGAGARPYLSVHFACCGVYQRIYRNPDQSAYEGHCPKCAKRVRFIVGPGGETARFFTVK